MNRLRFILTYIFTIGFWSVFRYTPTKLMSWLEIVVLILSVSLTFWKIWVGMAFYILFIIVVSTIEYRRLRKDAPLP